MVLRPAPSARLGSTARRLRGGSVGLLVLALVVLSALVAVPAQADYATGGTGRFQSSLQWIRWGANGQALSNAGETVVNTFVVGGETVAITCTVSNIADTTGNAGPSPYLRSYRSGNYSGDGLDNLYNIGGTGTNNQLVAGLATQSGRTIQFDFTCSGTLNGQVFPLAGLVMADAESTNGNGEYIAATIPPTATWRMIDRYRDSTNPACANNSILATRASATNRLTMRSTGECGSGSPMGVAFMDGTTSATQVTVKGGGIEAIALGVFVSFDRGDAPASYGDAGHAVDFPFVGGDIPADAAAVRINDPSFALATTAQPNIRLGATTDPEQAAAYSADADGDDLTLNPVYGNADDEDALSGPILVNQLPGTTYTLPGVACTGPSGGTATVAAWIDWNRNGTFDAGERSSAAPCVGTTTVALSWTVPADAVTGVGPQHTFMRVRIGPSPASVAAAVSGEVAGEVEDYPLDLVVPQPTATDDAAVTPFGTPVDLAPLANDTPADGTTFDPSSFTLVDPASGASTGTVTTPAGTFAVVPGTTTVRFTPAVGYRGPVPPTPYRVTDNLGRTATANLTVTVQEPAKPTPQPDTPVTAQGTPVSFTPADNDTPGPTGAPIVAASVRLLDPATGDPVTTLTVAGEGSYVVDPATGVVTFTPVPTFTGVASPIAYSIADTDGAVQRSSITATVVPVLPLAVPDEAVTASNVPVTLAVLANDVAGQPSTPLDPTSVRLLDTAGNPVTTLVVPGEGTYVVDPASGDVTFTPETGFAGPVTPPTYTVTDSNGTTTSSSLTITVSDGPAAKPDTDTTRQGTAVTLSPVVNDEKGAGGAQLDPTSLQLIDPATGTATDSVTVPGVGSYQVGANGTVTFTPAGDFFGEAPPLTYTVNDTNGAPATSIIQILVLPAPPAAAADVAATGQNTPVTISPAGNDTPGPTGAALDPTSVRLLDADGDPVTSLTVVGEGVYTVDPATGAVTFTPEPAFSGPGTPVRYSIADVNGATAVSTIAPNVVPVVPIATPDAATTPYATPVTTAVLGNDLPGLAAPLVVDSVRLVGVGGALVTTLSTPTGVYTANADGSITFTPAAGFVGTPPPVTYSVADINGTRATSTYTVTIEAPPAPVARDDAASTPSATPVTVSVLANDTAASGAAFDLGTLRLVDPATGQSVTTVTTAGVGTWVANTDGTVTFSPVAGFTGVPTIGYRVSDILGRTVSATVRVTVVGPTGAVPTPAPPAPLASTGADLQTPTGLGVLALVTGVMLMVVTRRRSTSD